MNSQTLFSKSVSETNSPTSSSPWSRRVVYRMRAVAVQLGAVLVILCGGGAAAVASEKTVMDNASLSTALTPAGGRITVEAQGIPPPPPLFFTANADESVHFGTAEITGEIKLSLRVVQGRPELLTLGLVGDGEVTDVTGVGLRDWSVRKGAGLAAAKRLLDLRPLLGEGSESPKVLELIVHTRLRDPAIPGKTSVLLLAPGDAVGFDLNVRLQPDATVDVRVAQAAGVIGVGDFAGPGDPLEFVTHGEAGIELSLLRRGAALTEAELAGVQLSGAVEESGNNVEFHLHGLARVEHVGARIRFLSGGAALTDRAAGEGWHAERTSAPGDDAYELVFERKGLVPVELNFAAKITGDGDWRRVDFRMPAGTIVPVNLSGLADGVEFDPGAPVVLAVTPAGWQGFLPADGGAVLAWKRTREKTEGALFFSSFEKTEVRVGAGLLRQTSSIAFRVLQGKLNLVRLKLDGPGEIIGVEGEGSTVLGWNLGVNGEDRVLEVRLSRPIEGQGTIVVHSQSSLGGFPARVAPVRLTPENAVQQAGFVRVANLGAVRLEVTDVEGMMQLAPTQFPGAAAEEGARQIFVYRYPSSGYNYRILASQILPEVGVSEVTTYDLGETERVIESDLELDVREAPLRDWTLRAPADYAVVAVQGAEVADYAVESGGADGARTVKVIFRNAVEGRILLHLRLEKNQAAAAGEWQLPALSFPGAKSVRGHVGVVAAAGFRVGPAQAQQLVEVPLAYFPRQVAGLQQAYRLRDSEWTAAVKVEALGQSVQADVFHLYSVKQGAVYASVLLNYFVVGAPANEWRIEVPATAGNIEVIGQGVRRDWRREGNQIVVALHQPVLGPATVLVTFEEPLSARGGTIVPGEVRPLGVQAERGYLQVVSALQVKNQITKAEGGLLKLEPLELPAEFRLFTTSPSLAVYQYTARPFALELGVDWYQPGETVDQVIDFAKLTSQVSRDGQVVTDARFFVKTRGRKALRLELGAGVKLWEARVEDEIVNARADGAATLVPLPPRLNPNEPVQVALRLGQPAGSSGEAVTLVAPRTAAPMVIGEWTLHGDPGRWLVPQGGSVTPTQANLAERGFEWIAERARLETVGLLLLVGIGALSFRSGAPRWLASGLLASGLAIFLALSGAWDAALHQRPNSGEISYAATAVPANSALTIEVANVAPWRAMISWWGLGAILLGVLALTVFARRSRLEKRTGASVATALATVLLGGGLLMQRTGAVWFLLLLALAVFIFLFIPGVRAAWQAIGTGRQRELEPIAPVLMLMLVLGASLIGTPEMRAAAPSLSGVANREVRPRDGTKTPETLVQRWDIRDGRLHADVEVTVRGIPGESFLLLKSPAVITDFAGEGLRIGKLPGENGAAYYVMPEREGVLTARVKFEMPVPDLAKGILLPTGPAALQRVTLLLDQAGWQFSSPMAVQVQPTANLGEGQSGATLVLGLQGAPRINFSPLRRDPAAETTQFFSELANLYVPGPGVVNGYSRVTVRPVQGRLSVLEIEVPVGFTVGEVDRGPVGSWRFDPKTRRLHVAVEPAQTEPFAFVIETQRGAAALPFDLALQPLRVSGSAGEVGLLALAFGGDAQPGEIKATALSVVSVADFDASLLPRGRDQRPLATLQSAYRYNGKEGTVTLRVAPVAPEVRVTGRQVLSLGDDRLVLAADLNVAITRVGLFKLSFALPAGLEIETASGPALSHWTETDDTGQRIVTLHLNGRTLGEQNFALTLVGPVPAAQPSWNVPRISLREATRQTGELQLVPERGLRLRAMARTNVSEIDARTVGSARPGVLAFRLLQDDWTLAVGIEALEPWVTVQSLQAVTVREGQVQTRVSLHYRIENAAIKKLRISLPGLSPEQEKTVRATGPAVSDLVPVAGEPGHWEIHFQRGMIGEAAVQIEFQRPASTEANRESIGTPGFDGVRQITQFVAIRGGGQLELEANDLPRGWQRVDWGTVPAALQDHGDRSVPALTFRVAEPEKALDLAVRRHDVADALKLRVAGGRLTTVLSPTGPTVTAVELEVEVVEKSTLRVRLPEGARLFTALVNGENVSLVREGDAYFFHVSPNTAADRSAKVRLVYAVMQAQVSSIALLAPGLNVPLENVAWRVVIPPGYQLADYHGGLRLRGERETGSFDLSDYQTLVVAKREADTKQANDFLQQAGSLLQKGQQQLAGEMLSRVSNVKLLDEATNEDARVQLRTLKTQQTVLGLNTRRQRLYLDNSGDAPRNEQLEQAARLNPFMKGKMDFDPQQVDQLMQGNSVEENAALQGIAGRIVDQQLAIDPAPTAIDVTLPERGQVVTFTRSLQVEGGTPLELHLAIEPERGATLLFSVSLLVALGVVGGLMSRRAAQAA